MTDTIFERILNPLSSPWYDIDSNYRFALHICVPFPNSPHFFA